MSKRKQFLEERANGCCEYCFCQVAFSPDPFSIEHILPTIKHGADELENLAFACQGCNNRKYTFTEAVDPVSGNTVSLYHPRKDDWHTHFRWTENYSIIVGVTPTGRATVERLQLNRIGVVNLRKVLWKFGKHPKGK